MDSQDILVIGAGVIGLSTAVTLQKRQSGARILIVAEELPFAPAAEWQGLSPSPDYASMWAGAHYRPIPGAEPQVLREKEWGFRTGAKMKRIAHSTPEAGVLFMPGLLYLEDVPQEYANLKSGDSFSFRHNDTAFSVLDGTELPEGVAFGCKYDSYCINPQLYCKWLFRTFTEGGGQHLQHKLGGVLDAFRLAEATAGFGRGTIVVNCSGRNFDSDNAMQIIRGQTVLVRNEYHRTTTRLNTDGSWCFLIPRPYGGGTIVGGTKEPEDWESQARSKTRKDLLAQAVRMFPDFVDSVQKFDVVRDNVGRRPFRKGGVRIELERLPDGYLVVHGYGAGGRGYELSWGIAEDIADVVGQCVSNVAKL